MHDIAAKEVRDSADWLWTRPYAMLVGCGVWGVAAYLFADHESFARFGIDPTVTRTAGALFGTLCLTVVACRGVGDLIALHLRNKAQARADERAEKAAADARAAAETAAKAEAAAAAEEAARDAPEAVYERLSMDERRVFAFCACHQHATYGTGQTTPLVARTICEKGLAQPTVRPGIFEFSAKGLAILARPDLVAKMRADFPDIGWVTAAVQRAHNR